MRQAIMEGMIRGFSLKDFFERNVYAIPYGQNYSLVTSVDFCRKRGMKGGVVGVSRPEYTEVDGKIESCTVTVKKKIDNYIGEFSATVYFSEYNTGKNQWLSKPRTMIAKVAEMHALRKACPDELSNSYIEEEFDKSRVIDAEIVEPEKVQVEDVKSKLEEAKAK